MRTTMDLLDKALSTPNKTQTAWCKELQIGRTTLAVARIRGRLSPTIAGNLARLLGEPIEHWIAVAALESEPDTPARTTLIKRGLKWSMKALQRLRRSPAISPGAQALAAPTHRTPAAAHPIGRTRQPG